MTSNPSSSLVVSLYIRYAMLNPNAITTAPWSASGILRRRRSLLSSPARAHRQSSRPFERSHEEARARNSRIIEPTRAIASSHERTRSLETHLNLRSAWSRTYRSTWRANTARRCEGARARAGCSCGGAYEDLVLRERAGVGEWGAIAFDIKLNEGLFTILVEQTSEESGGLADGIVYG